MRLWTYGEADNKVRLDTDNLDEDFVTPDEMCGYFNEAIDQAEGQILKISEDYFLQRATLTATAGVSLLSAMPVGMYASKIRGIVYKNGTDRYPVMRFRGANKIMDIMDAEEDLNAPYRYQPFQNETTGLMEVKVFPVPRETGAYFYLFYLRNAHRVPLVTAGSQAASDAIVLDLPECENFIMAFVRWKVWAKDGTLDGTAEPPFLTQARMEMVATLTEMVPDNDSTVVPDLTHYEEHL